MPATHFAVRTHHRLPVACTVYYANAELDGTGNLWNLSLTGCRVDGNVPVRAGMRFKLLVLLPGKHASLVIREAQVAWTRGQEFGLSLVSVQAHEAARLEKFVRQKIA